MRSLVGVYCGVKVTNMRVMTNDGFGDPFPTIKAETSPDGVAAIGGDSGGPVPVPFTDGSVGAAGMIQAHTAPPLGSFWTAHDPANHGKYDVLLSSMRTIVNDIPGASLRVK